MSPQLPPQDFGDIPEELLDGSVEYSQISADVPQLDPMLARTHIVPLQRGEGPHRRFQPCNLVHGLAPVVLGDLVLQHKHPRKRV